jgi:ParB/RepB/Spo0J family partition protein
MQSNHVQKFSIAKLKSHPLQQQLFGDLPEGKLAALAADIDRNGLHHPIEVLPDRTIIKGHQRLRAFERLGREEIDAIVRSDLAEKGELAIKEEMLADNAHRKQMSKLEQVRVHLELIETRAKQDGESHGLRVRDKIAEIVGICPRNVGRYLSVLEAPKEVQAAFELGEITLTEAEKVGAMPSEKKEEIALRISAGEPARDVVHEAVKRSKKSAPKLATVFQHLTQALDAATEVFPDRLEDLSRFEAKPENAGLFEKAMKMLKDLRAWNSNALKCRQAERSQRESGDCTNSQELKG